MAYKTNIENCIREYASPNLGLTDKQAEVSMKKFGRNQITKKTGRSFFRKIIDALCDPMILILEFALILTLGINIGKQFKSGNGDFLECVGIIFSIVISVCLTLIMEGKSQKAFRILNGLYDKSAVKVRRNGKIVLLPKENIVVGDRVIIQSGDKICADGRLVESVGLETDESMLTGESQSVQKNAQVVLKNSTPLAERINCVYSGTCVVSGKGEMIVTAVGDKTEMGLIAGELQIKNCVSAPLNDKLNRLGRTISAIGIIAAFLVFILSLTKLAMTKSMNYESITEIVIEAIVLIVAAVPEGLPATVAISLTLNVLKLSKSNALIKKMVATETVGCISVICSDKTGTLTQNKMVCERVIYNGGKHIGELISQNILYNCSINLVEKDGKIEVEGSATERALYNFVNKATVAEGKIISVVPFSSETKVMTSVVEFSGEKIEFLKGAPEKVRELCGSNQQFNLTDIQNEQKKGKRCLAFAHRNIGDKFFTYDGFACICDPIRPEVFEAVEKCKRAGIRVKILTGDNSFTALSVARELNLDGDVLTSVEVEGLTDEQLKERIDKVAVIARSTPLIKLRVVRVLKEMGEIVAVTGDGINDAPAMKQADIGIAMGSGSQVTKEAGDIILLDDSFSTIVKAIAFGRSIYRNFQRFLMFQLTVNFTAVGLIMVCSLIGIDSPFTSLQLLWLNIIMDGPPALSLALEGVKDEYMKYPPVRRSSGIVNKRLMAKILLNAFVIGGVVFWQYEQNFLNVEMEKVKTSAFALFTSLQIFNSFNCKQLGIESVFCGFLSNKLMLWSMAITLGLQVAITEFVGGFMGTPLGFEVWIKIFALSLTIILFSELYKFCIRFFRTKKINLQKNPLMK